MNDDRFRRDADLLLGELTWTQADSNRVLSELKGEPPQMKRKVSLGFILAMVLVLLAAVALAVGLTFSPKHTAVQTARSAVMAKYGLTMDMLQQFGEQASEQDGVTTVTYRGSSSEFLRADPMGEYTVTVDAKGNASVCWSHDGTDASALQSNDLTADVWGPVQLQMVIDRYNLYTKWNEETPYLSLLPIAEQAKRVAELDAAIAPCRVYLGRTELPDETDLSEDDALSLAKQLMKDSFGIDVTDGWRVERGFATEGEHGRSYRFSFQKGDWKDPAHDSSYQSYTLYVLSPSGEIVMDEEQSDATAATSGEPNPTPVVGLSEESALTAANQALADTYGITAEMRSLFAAVPSLDATDGKAAWSIAYLPVDFERFYAKDASFNPELDWRWFDTLSKKLGSYVVQLDAESGAVLKTSWSLDGEDTSADEASNWASASAFDERILPRVLALLHQNAGIIAKHPDDQTEWFSVEDAAAYDQAFRDAGFTDAYYNHALPKSGDLTAAQAKELAFEAMQHDYQLTRQEIDEAQLTCEYVLDNGGEWWLGFYTGRGMGDVKLNAATGEIQETYLDSASASNG